MEATLRFFWKFPIWNLLHAIQTATEIYNGGPHAIYWDMMVTNGRPVEYLLSIYPRSLGYSSSICEAKIKKFRYAKKTKSHRSKHALVLRNFFFCMLKQKFIIVVYFFVIVFAMVGKANAKKKSDNIFPIFSHISNTENLLILILDGAKRINWNKNKNVGSPGLVLNQGSEVINVSV